MKRYDDEAIHEFSDGGEPLESGVSKSHNVGSSTYEPDEFWDGRIKTTPDLSAVGHPELGARYNEVAYRFRMASLKASLSDLFPSWPQIRLFEAGFGVGFYLSHWASEGLKTVTAVDISSSAVERARRRHPEYTIFEQDLTLRLPPMAQYDLVTAIDVLYHIVDDRSWERALLQLCELVTPGGFFLFTEKFPTSHSCSPGGATHVRRRPFRQYDNVLQSCGFEVVRRRPVFVFMDDPITCGARCFLAWLSALQWKLLTKAIRAFGVTPAIRERLGSIVASIQLPFERLALRAVDRTPNLEMVVCKRSSPVAG